MMKRGFRCTFILLILNVFFITSSMGETLAKPTNALSVFESMYGYSMLYDQNQLLYMAPVDGENVDTFVLNKSAEEIAYFTLSFEGLDENENVEEKISNYKQTLKKNKFSVEHQDENTIYSKKGNQICVVHTFLYNENLYTVCYTYPAEQAYFYEELFKNMALSILPQPELRFSFQKDVLFVKGADKIMLQDGTLEGVLWTDENISDLKLYRTKQTGGAYKKGDRIYSTSALRALKDGVILEGLSDTKPMFMAEYKNAKGEEKCVLLKYEETQNRMVSEQLQEEQIRE